MFVELNVPKLCSKFCELNRLRNGLLITLFLSGAIILFYLLWLDPVFLFILLEFILNFWLILCIDF